MLRILTAIGATALIATVSTQALAQDDDDDDDVSRAEIIVLEQRVTDVETGLANIQLTPGPDGPQGPPGEDGVSVTSTALPENDPNCNFGGSRFDSANATTFACDGAPGQDGQPGLQGEPGPQGEPGILGLAGKSCPEGLAVTGFDANGNLVCGAPWIVDTTPSDVPGDVTIGCLVNFDPALIETAFLPIVEDSLAAVTAIDPPSQIVSLPIVGDVTVDFDPLVVDGIPLVTAELLELVESQPCDDAIDLRTVIPMATVTAQWSVGISSFPSASGTLQVDAADFFVTYRANLEVPEGLADVTVDTSFERPALPSRISASGVGPTDITIESAGALGTLLNFLLNNIGGVVVAEVVDAVTDAIASFSTELDIDPIINAHPVPVVVEVTVGGAPPP